VIPYGAIVIVVGVVLGVWAFLEAGSAAGRLLVAALMVAIFVVPSIWRGTRGQVARFVALSVFGIGCYLFVKLRGGRLP
jgi:ABC-type dipeptide/oligopeptide/nickel transport system permease component